MITQAQAAALVAYTATFTGTNVKGTEAAVWMDYLNSPEGTPDATPEQLQTATRRACTTWANIQGYRNPINPADIATAHRHQQHKTIDAWEAQHGPLTPPPELDTNPRAEIEWLRKARQAIATGNQTAINALTAHQTKPTPMPTPMPALRPRLKAI